MYSPRYGSLRHRQTISNGLLLHKEGAQKPIVSLRRASTTTNSRWSPSPAANPAPWACGSVRLPMPDPDDPPPGPFRPTFWRSPLRGPWLTSILSLALLIGIPIVAVTGLFSNAAYYPSLGRNSLGRPLSPLDFYLFSFPTHPSWLYGLN